MSRNALEPLNASNKIEELARTVHITTPIPTLEEFGKSLGLSKTRQASLLRLVRRDTGTGFDSRHHELQRHLSPARTATGYEDTGVS